MTRVTNLNPGAGQIHISSNVDSLSLSLSLSRTSGHRRDVWELKCVRVDWLLPSPRETVFLLIVISRQKVPCNKWPL